SIRNMLSSEARVIRDSKHETMPTSGIVPGEIIVLRAGARLAADMRLMGAQNLRVEGGIHTGVSTVGSQPPNPPSGELPRGRARSRDAHGSPGPVLEG